MYNAICVDLIYMHIIYLCIAVDFPGQIYHHQHIINTLYTAACLDDSFVSPDLLAYLDPLEKATQQLYDIRGVTNQERDKRCPRKGMQRLHTIQAHDVETCFWVDLHIDDAAMFNNSVNGSVRNLIL